MDTNHNGNDLGDTPARGNAWKRGAIGRAASEVVIAAASWAERLSCRPVRALRQMLQTPMKNQRTHEPDHCQKCDVYLLRLRL